MTSAIQLHAAGRSAPKQQADRPGFPLCRRWRARHMRATEERRRSRLRAPCSAELRLRINRAEPQDRETMDDSFAAVSGFLREDRDRDDSNFGPRSMRPRNPLTTTSKSRPGCNTYLLHLLSIAGCRSTRSHGRLVGESAAPYLPRCLARTASH